MTARDVIAQAIWAYRDEPTIDQAAGVIERLVAAPDSVRQELVGLLNPWRPIETAPKDGWFLAWDKKAKEWEHVHASAVQHVSGKPWKYWHPLPAPPKEDKA